MGFRWTANFSTRNFNSVNRDGLQTFKLPEYWEHPSDDMAKRLYEELQRELPSGHLLCDVPVEVFAWTGGGNDDVLFRHLDKPDRFTIIHLSWLGRTEINAQHPTVEFDGCFAKFLDYHKTLLAFLNNLSKTRNT